MCVMKANSFGLVWRCTAFFVVVKELVIPVAEMVVIGRGDTLTSSLHSGVTADPPNCHQLRQILFNYKKIVQLRLNCPGPNKQIRTLSNVSETSLMGARTGLLSSSGLAQFFCNLGAETVSHAGIGWFQT